MNVYPSLSGFERVIVSLSIVYVSGLFELLVPPFKLYLIAYSVASHLAVKVTSFAIFQLPLLTLLLPLYQPAKS